jgi:phosphoserine phosphatase
MGRHGDATALPGAAGPATPPERPVPLVVDLDGTLVRTDLLLESLFMLAKRSPHHLLLLPVWLARGRAALKRELVRRAPPDVTTLPYRRPLIERLAEEKRRGRRVVLATAADATLAAKVAQHLGLFDQVLASDGRENLARERKRDRLVAEFGAGGFDYVGSGRSDQAIWRAARKAVIVRSGPGPLPALPRSVDVETLLEPDPPGFGSYFGALRPHQWLKNALVFVPLLATGQMYDLALLWPGLLAFVAFGLCASSAYLINDLLDLPSDRHHPRKRARPLASGQVPLAHAVALAALLLLAGLALGALWSPRLLGMLGLYYLLTMSYSLRLKDVVILDVLALAGLYTLRVMAGAAAFAIAPSPWLLAFCVFLFFSLAMVKR